MILSMLLQKIQSEKPNNTLLDPGIEFRYSYSAVALETTRPNVLRDVRRKKKALILKIKYTDFKYIEDLVSI